VEVATGRVDRRQPGVPGERADYQEGGRDKPEGGRSRQRKNGRNKASDQQYVRWPRSTEQ
jgi:hypothetical protein